jgi:hypothetical protein
VLVLFADGDSASALIGAGGAVVGVLAGGFVTYTLERRREETRSARERIAEQRETQGIARVWSKKLGDFYVLVDDHSPPREGSSWWRDEHDVDSTVDITDMKRVAAEATVEQWRDIDYALTHIREVRAARAFAIGSGQASEIDAAGIDALRTALDQIERAIRRLADLSGDEYPPPWLHARMGR